MLRDKTVSIDGELVSNPLLNFELPAPIPMPSEENNSDAKAQYYVKDKSYETVRYPFSGIRHPNCIGMDQETLIKNHKNIKTRYAGKRCQSSIISVTWYKNKLEEK